MTAMVMAVATAVTMAVAKAVTMVATFSKPSGRVSRQS